MAQPLIDLYGKRFGRYVVIGRSVRNAEKGEAIWICKCDCGSKRKVRGSSLRNGDSTGCRKCKKNGTYLGRLITFHGETLNISEWAKKTGISRTTLNTRLNRHWSVEDALGTPAIPKRVAHGLDPEVAG